MKQINSAYPQFFDKNGSPLNNGSIWIGVAGQNPITTQSPVFWDVEGTQPAAQPLKTINGAITRAGTPSRVYINLDNYSIVVKDSAGILIFSEINTSASLDLSGQLLSPTGASLVGFSQMGAGAVNRTVLDKNREIVSVKDFGAIGDGVADDTAAIQNCLDTKKEAILFPVGIYKVTAPLICSEGHHIFGASENYSIIRSFNQTADVFVLGNNPVRQNNISIKNLTIDSFGPKTGGRFIWDKNTFGSKISDITLIKPFVGIELDTVVCFVRDIKIKDAVAASGINILVSGGNDHFIDNIVMTAPLLAQPAAGIKISASEATWISNSDSINCGVGLLVNPIGASTVAWLFVNQYASDFGNKSGIVLKPESGANIRGAHFINSWAGTNTGNGIDIDASTGNVDGVFINGQRCYTNTFSGIHNKRGTNVSICNSSIGGNLLYGINSDGEVNNMSINNNRIGDTSSLGTTQLSAIRLSENCNFSQIINNNLVGNLNSAILDLQTSQNKIISNNYGYATKTKGVASILVGQNEVNVNHGLPFTPSISDISVTATNDPQSRFWVSSVASTQFKISTSAAVLVNNINFSWSINVAGS